MAELGRFALYALAALALVIASIGPAAAQNGSVERKELVCMMQDTVMLKPGIPIEHGGKLYFGCCANCTKTIKADPERFTKAKDPVTGATVDKADALIYNIDGSALYFASEASREEFGRDPARYLAGPRRESGATN